MAIWCALALVTFVSVLVGPVQAAEVARLAGGRGHLASRVGDAEWQGLLLGDELPASSHLRTSPAGPVRVELPAGVLCLADETDVDLDVAAKRIVIERGRVLIRHSGEAGSWTVITGTTTFVCSPGSEAEISFAETIGANVLKGNVQVTRINAATDTPLLIAPIEWIGNEQGVAKLSVPTDDDWAYRTRRRTEPREEQGVGQLIAKDAQSDSPVRLEVARYHVNVVLQPPVALVQIDQSFFNPFGRQEEGTFVFNLPEGASVSRFAMFVTPDQLIEGELIDRKKADQVYTTIVRSQRDPAILEQIGNNLFRMRVFPIFDRDTKRILIDYTIPLVAERGRYRFELPLMSDLKPIWDFGITGVIHSPFAAGSTKSQTHPNLEFVEGDDGRITFSQQARNVQPPPYLLMEYRVPEPSQPYVTTFAGDGINQHFVVTLPESANPAPTKLPGPMDLLVLVDTSGSAGDLSRARLTARTLVSNLRPQDRWQLGCVDVGYQPITSDWLASRSPQSRAAFRQLEARFSLGGSRLDAATEESLQAFATSPENRRRVIVYLGDGVATMASDRACWQHEAFRDNNTTRIEFHAVKLGDDAAAGNWLKQVTGQTRGRVFTFHGSTTVLRDLFEWTLAGMPSATPIVSSGIENVPAENLFHADTWPRGRELNVFGRCKPAKSLELKLKLADLPEQTYRLNLVENRRDLDVFTGRLWAQNKLQALVTATPNPNDTAHKSIVSLCQEWSLMSPYTAFLVLETEKDYERWNIPRQLRHRYWKPAGTVEARSIHEHLRQLAVQHAVPKPQTVLAMRLNEEQRARVRRHLDAAKEALIQKNAAAAMSHLTEIRGDAKHVDSIEFESLMAEARVGLRRDVTLSELKLWQSLVDRHIGDLLPSISPLLMGFSHTGVNPEYLERHPHAMKLLKPAPEFNESKVSLTKFANAIQNATGIPVLIDKHVLREEGIFPSDEVDVGILRGVPVRTLSNLTLEGQLLTLIPESIALRITTQAAADERLCTHVYPVVDLLRSDVLPLAGRLANPNLDFDAIERKTTKSRLKHPITVRYADNRLDDALDDVFDKMGGAKFWIDTNNLLDEGIETDQLVSLTADKLPAEFVLNEILAPLRLDCMVRDGVITVTTRSKADKILETRVYSAAGIVDETAPDRNLIPTHNYEGASGGIGGLGGGSFGSGGGLGGGGSGGGGASGDALKIAGVGDVAPLQIDEPEPESASSETSESTTLFDSTLFHDRDPLSVGYDVRTPIWMVKENARAKWEDEDGEGGMINFHRPSFSFVIRQTQRAHAEIKEIFAKLRRLRKAARVGTSIVTKQIKPDDPNWRDYTSLLQLIQQSTSGKWEYIVGEGGMISPHLLTESLVVSQTEKVHEEIEQLLAQLRRARYVAESLPWMTSLEGIDDLITILDRPTVTDLPRNNLEAISVEPNAADEQRQLSVRQVPESMNQRWRSVSTATGQQRDVTIRRRNARLEVVLPDRTMRAEGPLAAVAYPGLTLVEINAWGDAARQVADSSLPWLPHRSNSELAQLFDVTAESDNVTAITLRLNFPGHAGTYLKATFSKQTGAPVKWQSVLADEPQYELQFAPEAVIAVDPSGIELERWELIAEDVAGTLPALDEGWGDFIVVEPSKPDAPLAKARDALRRGDTGAAIKVLANLLVDRQQQPLLNFLFAWSIGNTNPPNAAQARSQREALDRVAAAGPSDLLRLVTPANFPSIGAAPLREILLTIPEVQRTDDLWDRLNELAVDLNRYDLALAENDRAIALATNEAARIRRQVSRVELLLKNTRPIEAEAAAMALVAGGASPRHLVELGDIFGRAEQTKIGSFFFEKYLQTPNLTRREQSQAAYRQALWLKKGEARWRLLIATLLEGSGDQNQLLGIVLSEADQSDDADILGKLASELQSGFVQTQLLSRQAELTANKQNAAEIAWKLYSEKRLPKSRIEWAVEMLDRDHRAKQIVEILEQRLFKEGKIDQGLLSYLAKAYLTLGRELDSRRAATEIDERQLMHAKN